MGMYVLGLYFFWWFFFGLCEMCFLMKLWMNFLMFEGFVGLNDWCVMLWINFWIFILIRFGLLLEVVFFDSWEIGDVGIFGLWVVNMSLRSWLVFCILWKRLEMDGELFDGIFGVFGVVVYMIVGLDCFLLLEICWLVLFLFFDEGGGILDIVRNWGEDML